LLATIYYRHIVTLKQVVGLHIHIKPFRYRKSTCESRWTAAGKYIHLILTRATMLTWITGTFVDVRLTQSTCKRNRRIGKRRFRQM